MTSGWCRVRASLADRWTDGTQVLDQPVTGRIFFEEVIRENLDLGRPEQVQLIFDRKVTKKTPGRFQTRVITRGGSPRCMSITRVAGSNNTTKKAVLCAQKPRSMTRVTSRSEEGSTIWEL